MPRKLTKAQGKELLENTKRRQRFLLEARTRARLEQLDIEISEKLCLGKNGEHLVTKRHVEKGLHRSNILGYECTFSNICLHLKMLQNLKECTFYHLNVNITKLFKMSHFIHIIIEFFLQTV
jgi:hypothetical protein